MKRGVFAFFLISISVSVYAIPLPFEIARDPFQPFAVASSPTQSARSVVALPMITLKGVVWDLQDPYAVMVYRGARRIVKQGDVLDLWRVHIISPKDVTLKLQGRTLVLKMGQETKLL